MAGTATKLGDCIPLTTRGDLTLQICGSSRAGQIVQLKSHKCSIGSGKHCTLRVRGRSVKPLHCVIFRGSADTFVRSWGHDTRLNGHAFSDARLSPGDRIGVGSVEFEVLDPMDKRIQHGQAVDSRQMPPAAQSIDQQQAFEEQHRRWETARKEAEQQLGKRAKELDEQMAQLEGLEADLYRQQEEWEASRTEAEEQLVVRAAKVDKREAELDIRLAELRNAPPAADVTPHDSNSAHTVSPKGTPRTNQQTENASGDDESVEQYMARLLSRVHGVGSGQDANAKAETSESQPSADSSDPVSELPSREEHSEAEPDAESK